MTCIEPWDALISLIYLQHWEKVQQLAWENRMIYEIIVIVTYLVTGLVAEQCYTSTGGVYSAGSIYRNLKYCPFGCCGPALNRYCCPIVGPIVGICVGAIAFIVILIVIIVCCRKYSERQIRRRAEMKRNLGLTLSSRYDPPHYDTESNHVSSRQDYQIKSQSHHPTSSHRMYDEHDDDIDHRPNRKRHREDRYPQEENRHGSSHGHHRGETGSSRKHRHDSRREYHSDDDRLNSRRDSHRERRRHRDDHDRERRHSRSRERYMDRSYDDDDFSDEERYRRSSRRSRYSDPPPYRERSQDFHKDDRSSHRRTRSRERSYYN